jgi:hypothetical protein
MLDYSIQDARLVCKLQDYTKKRVDRNEFFVTFTYRREFGDTRVSKIHQM